MSKLSHLIDKWNFSQIDFLAKIHVLAKLIFSDKIGILVETFFFSKLKFSLKLKFYTKNFCL